MDSFRADVQAEINNDNTGESRMSNVTEILDPAVRLLDSRDFGETGRLDAEDITTITVPNPGNAVAAMVTLTSVDPRAAGYFTAWPAGPVPAVSSLNYVAGQSLANTTVVPLTNDGKFNIFTKANTHLIVDLVALYRP
jgi:hypothetical protein